MNQRWYYVSTCRPLDKTTHVIGPSTASLPVLGTSAGRSRCCEYSGAQLEVLPVVISTMADKTLRVPVVFNLKLSFRLRLS
jgi:hypothetical protein